MECVGYWHGGDTDDHAFTLSFRAVSFQVPAFWTAVVLYVVTGLFGITLSFHRRLSHKSFKAPKWLEYLFAYCGVLAFQGNPIDWVSTHRYHHQFCDSERDPHSPLDGFWFSHMNWLFDTNGVLERCGDPNNVGDLRKQPFYRFIEKTYIFHPIALGIFALCSWRLPFYCLGNGCEDRLGLPHHLVSELGLSCMGKTSMEHLRFIKKQSLGSIACIWRGMAQQPPCIRVLGSTWVGMVAA